MRINDITIYGKRLSYNIRANGVIGTLKKLKRRMTGRSDVNRITYEEWCQRHFPDESRLAEQRTLADRFSYKPLLSIVIPLFNSDPKLLKELMDSIEAQTYRNFEIVTSDGSAEKLGISENTNRALEKAKGDYILFADHDDLISPDAFFEIVSLLNQHYEEGMEKRKLLIYSDEDKVSEDSSTYFAPHFKPDYNPDLLRSTNYICHLTVISRALLDMVGGLRPEFDGAQDYDLVLRAAEKADEIYHIPKILYHWRDTGLSTAMRPETKGYAFDAGRRAVEEHLSRIGLRAEVTDGESPGQYRVRYELQSEPKISIIIPNKDHVTDLRRCIESIDRNSSYRNLEYIIVENNSTDPETFRFYEELKKREDVRIPVWDKEGFNFSALCNMGAAEASGDIFLLLNNDTELMEKDAIGIMLGFLQREGTGAVGARLYFGDGTLQHAGVILGIEGVAGHAFAGMDEKLDNVYFNRSRLNADFSAVTGACLMVDKRVYNEVGGFDEGLAVAFNDIDFCLKIRKAGYLIAYAADATFKHYESKSRGAENTSEKLARFLGEADSFRTRWKKELEEKDPYYNPNLTLLSTDFSLTE